MVVVRNNGRLQDKDCLFERHSSPGGGSVACEAAGKPQRRNCVVTHPEVVIIHSTYRFLQVPTHSMVALFRTHRKFCI